MMWMFCLMFAADAGTVFTNLEIYEPLAHNEVAVTPTGHVFVMNFADKNLRHYSPHGEFLGLIGRPGTGPGEFRFLKGIFTDQHQLYVQDMDRIQIFDHKGVFKRMVSPPGRGQELVKTSAGWISANFMSMGMDASPIDVVWHDDQLQQSQKVFSFPRSGNTALVARLVGGVPTASYNPVKDRPFLAADPNGRFAYVCQPGDFKVTVIDTQARKVVRTLTRNEKPAPFSTEYGMAKLEEVQQQGATHGTAIKFEADFPEYFPLVRGFFISPEGHLVFHKWTSQPKQRVDYLVLDTNGQPVRSTYKANHTPRVAAVRFGEAYVLCYDDETGASISKVPLAAVDRTIENNPISDQRAQRFMVMGNH